MVHREFKTGATSGKTEVGLTHLSQVRGKSEDLADAVVLYGEAKPQDLTKKLAKAACKAGSARLKSSKCVSPKKVLSSNQANT